MLKMYNNKNNQKLNNLLQIKRFLILNLKLKKLIAIYNNQTNQFHKINKKPKRILIKMD